MDSWRYHLKLFTATRCYERRAFGAIGAITGHYALSVDLMFFSALGIVALTVVNASLVLVDYSIAGGNRESIEEPLQHPQLFDLDQSS